MMIRGLTISLLFAVLAAPAYAQDSRSEPTPQDNPQTRQTDQSEDDYRRSQRRRDTGDIFDDIDINTRSSGSGGILGREVKAIDRLDQESRRHLNKQRAKAMAEAQPGQPIDAAYEPSETAKSDEYVAKQEEAAWEEMMREANSGLGGLDGAGGGTGGGQGGGQGGQAGQGQAAGTQPAQAGQGNAGQGNAGQGQTGQPGQGQGGSGGQAPQGEQPSSSPLRGGSASSASSILDQIKGRAGSAGSGQAPQGVSPQDAGTQGQSAQSGQAQQGANSASGQTQNDGQTSAEAQSQAAAQAQAQAAATAAQAAAEAEARKEAAHAAAHRETISPLERLKRDPVERDDTGGRTSASDYLKRKAD